MAERIIPRAIEPTLARYLKGFRVVTLTGPRQAGKTTLLRERYPERAFLNLEDPATREHALTDPKGLLHDGLRNQAGVTIDEAQRAPELFSYIQGIVDESNRPGQFILSGSQNFLLMKTITQSLAGRAGVLHLLPFSLGELPDDLRKTEPFDQLVRGFYASIFQANVRAADWLTSYIETYLERDVRQVLNVSDLRAFRTFMKMCAGRTGQLVNLSALASDCGISHNTAKSWLSVLETSFIVKLVPPYFENFGKRLVKTPKLHFLDSGLAATLLGLQDGEALKLSTFGGSVFESWVAAELFKGYANEGRREEVYFWRDRSGHEVDLLFRSNQGKLIALEAKAGKTVTNEFFRNLRFLQHIAAGVVDRSALVYGGDQKQDRSDVVVVPWNRDFANLVR